MKVFLKTLNLNLTVVLFGSCLCLAAQTVPVESPSVQEIGTLTAGQCWGDIVRLLEPIHSRTADMDFAYGMALARLGRWSEAESALQAGRRLAPTDRGFSIELAGIAFKQKQYPRAAQRLNEAIKLAPNDPYANDFLGTIYFLEGNPEASLKYWNRVGKPEIAEVREDPLTRLSPALLDQALAFSPASTLLLPSYLDTDARIRGLGIFPQHHFDLIARDDGKFDVVFRSQERDGFGGGKWEALFLLLRGLPFQSFDPEFYNLHRDAINSVLLFRWDPQKRRIFAQLSGPFEHTAKYRYLVVTDLRNENWVLRDSFPGPAPALASMNLRRASATFDLASHASERLRWSAGAEVSYRDFRSVVPRRVLTPEMLAVGYQIKQQAQLTGTLWRLPEHRFAVNAEASSQAAHLWSHHEESFEKAQGALGWGWFPRAEGDDYETTQQVRAGETFGQAPFDELFVLGLERDNNLPMRAHIGTRDGQKGSAPMGREYLLTSWGTDKNIYGNGVITMKLGPFLDLGKIADPSSMPGPHKWLCDMGAQTKVRLFGSGVVFSYGKDLRSGNNAFYVTLLQ